MEMRPAVSATAVLDAAVTFGMSRSPGLQEILAPLLVICKAKVCNGCYSYREAVRHSPERRMLCALSGAHHTVLWIFSSQIWQRAGVAKISGSQEEGLR